MSDPKKDTDDDPRGIYEGFGGHLNELIDQGKPVVNFPKEMDRLLASADEREPSPEEKEEFERLTALYEEAYPTEEAKRQLLIEVGVLPPDK